MSANTEDKRSGSHCVWHYDGKEWPVVLCDDDTPPRAFINSRRRDNEIPAILLGKRKYGIWVVDDSRLQMYEPLRDYLVGLPRFDSDDILASDDQDTQKEKYRRIAFRDATGLGTPQFWRNFIEQRRKERIVEREIAAKWKRKRKYRDHGNDIEVIGVRRSISGDPFDSPVQKRSDSSGSGSGTCGLKGGKNGQLPTPGTTPTKPEIGSTSKLPIRIEDRESEDESCDEGLFVRETPVKNDRFTLYDNARLLRLSGQAQTNSPISDGICTIFIGNAKTPFQVSMDAIGKCEFLHDQVNFTEQLGSHIDLSTSTSVTVREFIPIHEYIQNGEFAPALTRDTPPRLLGLATQAEEDNVAQRCVNIFRTASQLQFAGLQMLAVEKLRALYPLSPLHILIVTRIAQESNKWGCDAEIELSAWLADHIAEYYYKLMAEHGAQLARVLRNSDDLDQTVAEKVAQNPKACTKGWDDD